MSFARIKTTFVRLPRHLKLLGVGALILGVSTILPWYADLDTYRIGDQFLGITGPASFVGIVILLLSGLSLWIFSYHLLERRVPKLPVREAIINIFVSVEAVFLLILVNSIYFHPKFGVNITLKESRFGMTFAFIGAILMFIGGILQNREESVRDREVGKLEPLIRLEPQTPRPIEQQVHQTAAAPAAHARPQNPLLSKREMGKNFLFGERPAIAKLMAQAAHATKPEHEIQPISAPKPAEEHKEDKPKDGGTGSYMLRMDL